MSIEPAASRQTPPSPSPSPLRVADADRGRTATVLGDAVAAGYLTLTELDERLAAVWSARTSADLRDLTADLPPALRERAAHREAADRARALARASLAGHVRSYLAVMLLLVGIWLSVGVSAGAWYPWPVWPALGWGIGLVGHARAASRPDGNHAGGRCVTAPWHTR